MPPQKVDILIVGAGPTGLMAAAEARRFGLTCRIIDQSSGPSIHSKALVVQPRTLEIWKTMGFAEKACAAGHYLKKIELIDEGQSLGSIPFEISEVPYSHPLILSQAETERILTEYLDRHGVTVERGVEWFECVAQENEVRSMVKSAGRDEMIVSTWLVAADGAHSVVRKNRQIPFEGSHYEEEFILCDVQVDWKRSPGQAYGFVSRKGMLGFVPMDERGRYRIIAVRNMENWMWDHPELKEFQTLVRERVKEDITLSDPSWLSSFRLHRRMVPQMRDGHIFFAGDAAHIHTPAGGQGMNTGLQDASNLLWKLALVTQGRARPEILDTYHDERHPVAKDVLVRTDRFYRMALHNDWLTRLSRRIIFPVLTRGSSFRSQFISTLAQLEIDYCHSPLCMEEGDGGGIPGPRPGRRAPEVALEGFDDGKWCSLLEKLQNGRHLLLVTVPPGCQESLLRNYISELDVMEKEYDGLVETLWVMDGMDKPLRPILGGRQVFKDQKQQVSARYGMTKCGLYVIRPDGYIGYRCHPPEASSFRDYFSRHYLSVNGAKQK